jgi:NTE family protein
MRERALVLGGGGSAGNAWLLGVLAGLVDAGLDVTDADLVVGTSAGATAAAQVLGTSPAELYDAVLAAPVPPRKRPGRPPVDHLERTGRIIAAATDPADMRRRLGAAALELEAESDGSWSARWRSIVAARLPSPLWPERGLLVTAVDARTGEGVVLDRHSGLDLVDAVAASTSSGLPYAVGDERYLDGGYRRSENADLAAGCERVLVLSPLGGRTRTPLEWGQHLAAQVDELRETGSRVETVIPDRAALDAFGDDLMDPATRAPAARAGHDQGRALAGRLSGLWR